MKYLSHYTEKAQTKLFKECGAFFAFSQDQFKEKAKKDVKYVSFGAGLICEKQHELKLVNGLNNIQAAGIKQDITENTIKKVIHRELANHEAQISMSIDETIDALQGYGITDDEIRAEFKEYYDYCIEHDCF